MRTLREDELRLLSSLRFVAGPETEGLIQPGLSLFALSGDGTEYLIWRVRSMNLFLGWVTDYKSISKAFTDTCALESALGEPLLFKRIVINSA